jgi:putative nucleotidyltransferase with HDIG domain
VQAFTLLLADHCGYKAADMQALSYGALLHDIGKIAIPDSIILKPGPLTADEARTMKQHPLLGYQILSRIPYLEEAAEITLRHHERIDGQGYPFGLRGDEVPLSVRIFSVADALDVMLSGRTYCAARSIDDAREELRDCAGSQFDADIIDVFMSVPPDSWLHAKTQVASHASTEQTHRELTIQ